MGRGLLHVGAWVLATAVAVTLSWIGVRSVLRNTAYDPPRALPIPVGSQEPTASATYRPSPTVTVTVTPSPSTVPAAPRTHRPAVAVTSTTTPPPATGNVHSYTMDGGRVVLDLAGTSASLVSATPNEGWRMQVWTQPQWLRVTFTSASGAAASSVICTWNGHAPSVQSYEN
ncbi:MULTISPECIES: hypothetical protein [unclassified Streptomyces]|uniref:hypothetical protein n=1 Tax=unclassified Streptomyces TaxID=2593676 RepID=UPI002E2BA9B8|nr:hypothetical protein [Streptomyces sp. NBC_00223]